AEIASQVQATFSRPQVWQASWEHWLATQPPCDLLLTDPPYSTEVAEIEAFAQAWLPLALAKVKSTGRAYVCIGAYPREIRAYLNVQAGLPVQQLLVWTYQNTLGPSPKYTYKQNWQAILSFCGPDAPPLDCPLLTEQFSVQEINAPDGRLGDRYDAWQKPDALAERLIRHSTRPGDRVYDPFCGTGTFVLAASRLGRLGLGCEISQTMLAKAEKRGCAIAR
ncbi:MAG TPA: site-specific DNA-methyltransferase, partial [Ktedonobacteraceae bacterium]|nr:site-specific DNA-methyltransferase [Ktedonobacteraceae bacterium]